MPQLDANERAVPMRLVTDHRQRGYVRLVPQTRGDGHRVAIRFRIDRCNLDADGGPATLRPRGAKTCLGVWMLGSKPGRMWNLEETVSELLGTNLDRLEEHVKPRIAPHR